MKNIMLCLSLLSFFASASCKNSAELTQKDNSTDDLLSQYKAAGPAIAIPLGGNAFVTKKDEKAEELIDENGLDDWSGNESVISIYFRVENPGIAAISLRMKVPAGQTTLKVSLGNSQSFIKTVKNTAFDTVAIGNFRISEKGYVKIDVQGISKTGDYFGNISDLIIKGQPVTETMYFVKDNLNSHYYWGRRGPSVHLNYIIPEAIRQNVEWFYNEIIVPAGMDPEGSYFQSNGFGEGYFGIQVNSATERRVLFSLWSPFATDDPANIPEDKKIKLLKKGDGVKTGEFGNEGSGGQSYLIYPWQAGKTYAFLTRAQPDAVKNKTTFTSYFKPENGNWMLIASFERPATNTSLKGIYSFLENFAVEMGSAVRTATYKNQWALDTKGTWTEILSMKFTGDDIAKREYRKDFSGGITNDQFFLKNGGFFSGFTTLNQVFTRPSSGKPHPDIDFNALP